MKNNDLPIEAKECESLDLDDRIKAINNLTEQVKTLERSIFLSPQKKQKAEAEVSELLQKISELKIFNPNENIKYVRWDGTNASDFAQYGDCCEYFDIKKEPVLKIAPYDMGVDFELSLGDTVRIDGKDVTIATEDEVRLVFENTRENTRQHRHLSAIVYGTSMYTDTVCTNLQTGRKANAVKWTGANYINIADFISNTCPQDFKVKTWADENGNLVLSSNKIPECEITVPQNTYLLRKENPIYPDFEAYVSYSSKFGAGLAADKTFHIYEVLTK